MVESLPGTAKRCVDLLLERVGLKISRVPRGAVSGLSLERDLRISVSKDSPICFDVGANNGQTIAMFKRAFDKPMVYAFEPNAATASRLRDTYADDIGVSIFDFGLGAQEEERIFHNYENSTLGSFLELEEYAARSLLPTKKLSESVLGIRSVDSLLVEKEVPRLDVLKIDTQGFDLEVLKGARIALGRGSISVIQIEVNFANIYQGQATATEVLDFLYGFNFELVDFYEKARRLNRMQWCTALFLLKN